VRRSRATAASALALLAAAGAATALSAPASGGVRPATADAPPSFTWSAPEPIDRDAPYARAIPITSMSCSSTTLCLAATEDHGELISSTNPTGTTQGTWSVLQTSLISEGATGYALAGTSCVTAGSSPFCVATGRNFNDPSEPGIAITTTEPTGGASAWKKTAFPTGLTTPPTCAYESSTTLCLISTGFNSELLVSTEPAEGASHWKTIAAGYTGDGVGTSGAACPTTTFCAAISYGAQFVASGEPLKQSAWSSPLAVGLNSAESLSCPTTTFCLAAGPNTKGETEVATSTNPTAGATSTWKVAKPTGVSDLGYYGGITCQTDTALASPQVICFAGANGTAAVSTDGGSTWTSETAFPGAFDDLGAPPVACPRTTLCLSGTNSGSITNSADAASGESASWAAGDQVTEGSNSVAVYEHACPSTSLCVAADGAGRIMTSTDPANGKASWSVEAPIDPGHGITNLECPSTSLCVAADSSGDILTSTNPAAGGTSWSKPVHIDSSGIARLACPSASLCVATDDEGKLLTSTSPAGGAADWSAPATIDSGQYITALSCATASFCVIADATGNVLTSTKPNEGATSWSHPEQPDPGELINAIACPSASLCVGAAGTKILTTTNPAGGASTWSSPVTVGRERINAIRCPSTTLCIATDGNAIEQSTDPAGGGATWSKPSELGPQYPGSLVCPSTSLCVISNYEGYVYTTTDPAGGIADWTAATQVDNTGELSQAACPSNTLCIFGDGDGSILTGKGAPAPESSTPPTIKGNTVQGETLTEHAGTWLNSPVSFGYQWQRCDSAGNNCVAIGGATAQTYILAEADIGSTIRVQETATNSAGEGPPAVSTATAVIEKAPAKEKEHEKGSEPPPTITSSGGGTPTATTSSTSTTTSTTSTVGSTATVEGTAAEILGALAHQLLPAGKHATIQALLQHGSYSYPFTAPGAGSLVIDWYLVPKGAHISGAKKPILIATGSTTFSAAGTATIVVKLTGKGKQTLKHSKAVKLTAAGTFTSAGKPAVKTTKAFTLKR